MLDIKPSIARGWGKGELYDVLVQLQEGMLPISGETYYVSTHGNNTTGLSWKNAFTTISAAITASDAYNVAKGGYTGKNRIYIEGGNYDALTAFPWKCDMIGVGGNPVRINGNSTVATNKGVCHIYNMQFRGTSASATPIVNITAEGGGVEFHNCLFMAASSNTSYIQIVAGLSQYKIHGCQFIGAPDLCTTGIVIGDRCAWGEIIGNTIFADITGISIAVGQANYGTLIKNNVIARSAPGASQLTTGIDILETQGRCLVLIVSNWISADTPISNSDDYKNFTINNHVVDDENGYLLTEETP